MAEKTDVRNRCGWALSSPLYMAYHDEEWGRPQHDDRRLFEKIVLEGAQAGISWIVVLRKRERYREVYDGFDPARVARYTSRKVDALLRDDGVVRNRLKIESSIKNARAFLSVQEAFGSFDSYIWRYVDGRPIVNRWTSLREIPPKTALSETISKDLKQRGFTFVGPTMCYAFMQGVGMVNDHLVDCWTRRRPSSR